jgi:hypothetical protein
MNQAPSPLTPDSKQADPDFRAIVMASLYLAIFLTILGLAYTGNRPGCIGRIRYLDKAGHMVLYTMPGLLGFATTPPNLRGKTFASLH